MPREDFGCLDASVRRGHPPPRRRRVRGVRFFFFFFFSFSFSFSLVSNCTACTLLYSFSITFPLITIIPPPLSHAGIVAGDQSTIQETSTSLPPIARTVPSLVLHLQLVAPPFFGFINHIITINRTDTLSHSQVTSPTSWSRTRTLPPCFPSLPSSVSRHLLLLPAQPPHITRVSAIAQTIE